MKEKAGFFCEIYANVVFAEFILTRGFFIRWLARILCARGNANLGNKRLCPCFIIADVNKCPEEINLFRSLQVHGHGVKMLNHPLRES